MIFENRAEAGKMLTAKLANSWSDSERKNLLVLAIPRGGVVVGKELANRLSCPLDVIVTKKIGAPGNPELAVGAVSALGEPIIDEQLATQVGADEKYLKSSIVKIKFEVERREEEFRLGKPPLELKNKTVILTDDGVATGVTMLAAIDIVRQQDPKKIIVAVPVIAKDSLAKIEQLADEVVYLEAPDQFFAVGQFYKDFQQVTNEEVAWILKN